MAFYTGTKTNDQLINFIADKLIGTTGWSNPELATGYFTGDLADVKYGVPWQSHGHFIGRVCKWTDGAENLYVAFEEPYYDANQSIFQLGAGSTMSGFAAGIRVTVSETWDTTNHHYPSAEANHVHMMTTFWNNNGGMNNIQNGELHSRNLLYWLWLDEESTPSINGNGLCFVARPDPSSWYTISSFFNIEKLVSKESGVSPSYGSWHLQTLWNVFPYYYSGTGYDLTHNWTFIEHPFAPFYGHNGALQRNMSSYYYIGTDSPKGVLKGIDWGYPAYKSDGNGKVYFMKPVAHNVTSACMTPLYQLEHFFKAYEGQGLVDGDIIALAGVTAKYLVFFKDSPSSTQRLTLAMRYVA